MEELDNRPRRPTRAELNELAALIQSDTGCDEEHAHDYADFAFSAVFDHYGTDCPGYQGKAMVVIWTALPSFYDVYIWVKGKMRQIKRSVDKLQCIRCGDGVAVYCDSCWEDRS